MRSTISRRGLLRGTAAISAVPTVGIITTAPADDPIFAVIAEHQAALKASIAANCVRGHLIDGTQEWKIAQSVARPAQRREADAHAAVLETDPTTLAGVVALLEHVGQPEFLEEHEDYPDSRETLLSAMNECLNPWKRRGQDFPLRVAGALRLMAGTVIIQRPSGPDPIYEVIATHRRARAVWNASPYGCMKPGDLGEAEAEAADKVLEDREIGALKDVLTTRPTTIAGLLALLDYIAGHPDYLLREGGKEAETFPALLATTVRSLIAPHLEVSAKAVPSKRDPIFAAIRRHRAAWKDLDSRCGLYADDEAPEAQAALAALHDEVSAAVDDLNNIEPTTIAGAVALLRYVASKREMTELLGVELLDPGVLANALANPRPHDPRPFVFNPEPYDPPDPASIPKREWLYGRHYLRGIVSASLGAPGRLKSTTSMTELIGMGVGRDLFTGEPLECGPLRVAYLNGEENQDELDRRFAGICQRYSITKQDFGGRVWIMSTRDNPIRLAIPGPKGAAVVAEGVVDAVLAWCEARSIDVLAVDPLISFHRVRENDSGDMDLLCKEAFGAIAGKNRSVDLVVHPRKPAPGEINTTIDDLRGSSAQHGAVRTARTFNFMTTVEAAQLGVEENHRRLHVRIENGKGGPGPLGKATWVKIEVENLFNGDQVAIAVSWKPPDHFADHRCSHGSGSELGKIWGISGRQQVTKVARMEGGRTPRIEGAIWLR
jgi:hypothetical protein